MILPQPQYEDNLKKEDGLKNEDNLKHEDDLKMKMSSKMKIVEDHTALMYTVVVVFFIFLNELDPTYVTLRALIAFLRYCLLIT